MQKTVTVSWCQDCDWVDGEMPSRADRHTSTAGHVTHTATAPADSERAAWLLAKLTR